MKAQNLPILPVAYLDIVVILEIPFFEIFLRFVYFWRGLFFFGLFLFDDNGLFILFGHDKTNKRLLFFSLTGDLNAVVITALFADLMRRFEFVALRAFYQIGARCLIVACKSFVSSLLGNLSFRNRHK